MPTENRSSNTELSKIVTEALVGMVSGVTGMKPPADEPLPGFIQAPIDRAVTRISGLLAQPAPHPHPEPIAWMVGAAIWWTKAEAERDSAEVGLPVIALGPISDPGEVERLRGKVEQLRSALHGTQERWAKLETALLAQLTERDALLADIAKRHWSGVDFDLPADLVTRIKALSASAEPSAQLTAEVEK